MSCPSPALDTIRPISTNSGIVAKVYSIGLSAIAILVRPIARSKFPRMIQMARNDTMPSAMGM